jgi:hypothetical protein
MKTGQPVFDCFDIERHIDSSLELVHSYPLTLAINSENNITTAVLIQLVKGQHRVLSDWIAEGDPGTALADLVHYAQAFCRPSSPKAALAFQLVAPPSHFGTYDKIGLRAAVRRLPGRVSSGSMPSEGLDVARRSLLALSHGRPQLVLGPAAVWARRAFLGGYSFDVDLRSIAVTEKTIRSGPYKTLMEGLTCALTSSQFALDEELVYDYTAKGARFITMRR